MTNLLRLNCNIVKSALRLQSPTRSCPHCGWKTPPDPLLSSPGKGRPYSASSKTNLSIVASAVKKVKRKSSKKVSQSLTEIIEETANASISESTKTLSKLKPKEVTKCIQNLNNSPSSLTCSIKRMPLPLCEQPISPSAVLAMNYATSSNSPFSDPVVNFSAVPSASRASSNELPDLVYEPHEQHLTPEELLQSFASQNDVGEETRIIVNHSHVPISIPSEKDLIDSEIDYDLNSVSIAFPVPLESEPVDNNNFEVVSSPSKNSFSSGKKPISKKNNSKRSLKKDDREKVAKVRKEEMERFSREVSLNKSLVAYLEMCVFTDQLNRGLNTLNYYRHRSKVSDQHAKVSDIAAYNIVLRGFAGKGNILKVREVFRLILEDNLSPNPQSHAALLECLGRNPPSKGNFHSIRQVIKNLEDAEFHLQDLFNKTTFDGDQREVVLEAIHRVKPSFKPVIIPPFLGYVCPLLTHLNEAESIHKVVSQAEGVISLEKLEQMAKKQLETELRGTVTVKSIEKKDNLEHLSHYRKVAHETEKQWAVAIEEALQRNMSTLFNQGMSKQKTQRSISLYPFLKVLPPSDYSRIIIQEIRKLAEGSETYSPGVAQLYRELGNQVLARYQVLYKEKKGILQKVEELYNDYIRWYLHPSDSGNVDLTTVAHNPRQKWQNLLFHPESSGPHVDIAEKVWPNSVLSSIGRFLYGIIMRDIKINANVMKMNSKNEQMVPAFYSIFRMQGMHLKEEIKPHPALVKLFQAASRDELTFDATLVPMVSPPLPWASIRTGGYLLSPARIVRLPFQAHQQKLRLETCRSEDLYPSLDSLNQLGIIPWKINHKVLDTVIEVFNNKGNDDLGISPPPSECPNAPPIEPNMTKQEKYKVHKQRLAVKRRKAEMYSLWCDALYRLSLANHFRDDVFWFPHNMDFRGRVYPCPPHLNHLGADVARAILVFANGKPLGFGGLDWLKIHLVNLTGLKKRDCVQGRLDYANEILDDILDSADHPLTGRKWWAESEEPWQTLACCIEIANAIRSGDPASYVSHFPIHQDGSCNGLQHYAALGRDQAGAESVNLAPSDYPQDVYSSVATLVEKLRDRDARNGVKIAQVLEGFIKRKVIKQTVMTTVYGVTRYGARLQIAKQLKDIPDFPKEHLWPASLYLVARTFDSLQEMFTSTKEIQDWFTECARLISQVCGQNVEWITPLGLPVVQPYFRPSKKGVDSHDPLKLPEVHIFDLYERPNVMKQKNAFPPNFIHSLDSSHMMLTSLHCERAGITFVSVHDCYWTHPCTVEIMNRICREQFVALHSQPILEDLSTFLVEKYSYKESEFFRDGSVIDMTKSRLNKTLEDVPEKGSFDLRSVLSSIYFFS